MLRRLTIAVLMPVLAFALLACGGDDDEGGGAGDIEDVDATELLDASAARMEEVESFHFDVEHENGSTPIVAGLAMTSAQGDVQGTDRMRLEVNARFAGTNVRVEIIVLPDTAYLSNPITGRWEQQDLDVSQFFDPSSGVTALMRDVEEAEVVDRERVRGTDTYVVVATVDAAELDLFVPDAQPGTRIPVRVWIGVDDPLVHRVAIEGPLTPDDAPNIVRRLELSEFDEPVEITAP